MTENIVSRREMNSVPLQAAIKRVSHVDCFLVSTHSLRLVRRKHGMTAPISTRGTTSQLRGAGSVTVHRGSPVAMMPYDFLRALRVDVCDDLVRISCRIDAYTSPSIFRLQSGISVSAEFSESVVSPKRAYASQVCELPHTFLQAAASALP